MNYCEMERITYNYRFVINAFSSTQTATLQFLADKTCKLYGDAKRTLLVVLLVTRAKLSMSKGTLLVVLLVTCAKLSMSKGGRGADRILLVVPLVTCAKVSG